ncbi:hypothetical protein Ancab_028325 [Ancistrocladus abbreviatus]
MCCILHDYYMGKLQAKSNNHLQPELDSKSNPILSPQLSNEQTEFESQGNGNLPELKHPVTIRSPKMQADLRPLRPKQHGRPRRNIDARKQCSVGPGMAFANVVRNPVGLVGLVPCAVGGTAMKEWARGERLYENMVKRVRAAMKEGEGGEVKALLWYQGESATLTHHDAEAYQGKMEKLISDVREDLQLPLLTIYDAQIR